MFIYILNFVFYNNYVIAFYILFGKAWATEKQFLRWNIIQQNRGFYLDFSSDYPLRGMIPSDVMVEFHLWTTRCGPKLIVQIFFEMVPTLILTKPSGKVEHQEHYM